MPADSSVAFSSLDSTYAAALTMFNQAREKYLDSIQMARGMFVIDDSVIDPVNSTSVSSSTVSSKNECAVTCSNTASCSGATYDSSDKSCTMFSGDVKAKGGGESQFAIVRKSGTYLAAMNNASATMSRTGRQMGAAKYTQGASNNSRTSRKNNGVGNILNFLKARGAGNATADDSAATSTNVVEGGTRVQQMHQNIGRTEVVESNNWWILLHMIIYLLLVVMVCTLAYHFLWVHAKKGNYHVSAYAHAPTHI